MAATVCSQGSIIYVGCQLRDGSFISGALQSHSRLSAETGDRDLLIRGEVTFRPSGSDAAAELPGVHLVIVSARDVVWTSVSYSRGVVPQEPVIARLANFWRIAPRRSSPIVPPATKADP